MPKTVLPQEAAIAYQHGRNRRNAGMRAIHRARELVIRDCLIHESSPRRVNRNQSGLGAIQNDVRINRSRSVFPLRDRTGKPKCVVLTEVDRVCRRFPAPIATCLRCNLRMQLCSERPASGNSVREIPRSPEILRRLKQLPLCLTRTSEPSRCTDESACAPVFGNQSRRLGTVPDGNVTIEQAFE